MGTHHSKNAGKRCLSLGMIAQLQSYLALMDCFHLWKFIQRGLADWRKLFTDATQIAEYRPLYNGEIKRRKKIPNLPILKGGPKRPLLSSKSKMSIFQTRSSLGSGLFIDFKEKSDSIN